MRVGLDPLYSSPLFRTLSLALLLGQFGAASARAATTELLVPLSRVSERGVVVAAGQQGPEGWRAPEEAPTLTAAGARVSPLPPLAGLPRWRVTPARGATEVVLTLGETGAKPVRIPVGPPASTVTLELEPAAPVKGRDREAKLRVTLRDGEGKPWASSTPPVLRASVGSVEALRAVGPGRFEARYVLPTTRYPEVAVLVAFAPWPHADSDIGALGGLRVGLATAIELPGRSEPGAALSMKVGGVEYGPVTVGDDGRFAIPVVVPPGEGEALSTVQDRLGNRRRERIDLRLPPVDPLACVVNPPRVPADGMTHARILCGLSDARARAVRTGRIALDAQHGAIEGPRPAGDGLVSFRYAAPAAPFVTDVLEARARLKGVMGRESLQIREQPAPATDLTLTSTEPILHRGGSTTLLARATDARGKGVAGVRVRSSASVGELAEAAFDAEGTAQIAWSAPRVAEGTDARAKVEVTGPTGTIPAQLYSWVSEGRLWLGVGDPAGLPVANTGLRVAGRDVTTDARGRVALPLPDAPVIEVHHAEWTELRQRLFRIGGPASGVFPERRPPQGSASIALTLGPALPVNVRLELEGRLARYWAESPGGTRLTDRELAIRSSAGALPQPRCAADGRCEVPLPDGAQLLSVSDVASGVTAAAQVDP